MTDIIIAREIALQDTCSIDSMLQDSPSSTSSNGDVESCQIDTFSQPVKCSIAPTIRIVLLIIVAFVLAGFLVTATAVFEVKMADIPSISISSPSILSNNSIRSSGIGSAIGSGINPNITIICSKDFYISHGSYCVPECGKWSAQTNNKFHQWIRYSSGAGGMIIIILVLFLSFFNYKKIFQFPGIVILYQDLGLLSYVAVLYSIYGVKKDLCQSKDLLESLKPGNETALCILSGSSWIYFSSQVASWGLFHISMIFFSVYFPFKYKYWKEMGYLKYTHIVMLTITLVLPLVPVIICIHVGGFVLDTFIQPVCVPRNPRAAYYSHVLPVMIVVAIGFYQLLLIWWKFLTKEWLLLSCKKRTTGKREIELKLLIILLLYIVIYTIGIAVNTEAHLEFENYTKTLVDFFSCESSGSRECSRDRLDQFDPTTRSLASVATAAYPCVLLIYFVNHSTLKKACMK